MLVPLIPLVTDYKNKTSNKVIKILVDTVTNDDHDVKQISIVAFFDFSCHLNLTTTVS